MNIINFKNLAKNNLRKKALLIAEAGYEAIEIEKVVSRKIKFQNGKVFIKSALTRQSAEDCSVFDLSVYKRVSLIGVGKGSSLAVLTLSKILAPLGYRFAGAISLDIKFPISKSQFPNKFQIPKSKIQFFIGTHPLPSQKNVTATQKIIKLVKSLNKDDLLIAFICGGGSALLCGSEKELKNSVLATKLLTQAGANILELNIVRKHLSNVKGGGLAKLAYPATVISLIISDVLGNDLSMVASGPTAYNKTTKDEAEKIWRKYFNMGTSDVLNVDGNNFGTSDGQKIKFHETPKNKKYFKKAKNILFLSNREPILAMLEKTKELGLKPKIYSLKLHGEASNALLPLIKSVPRVKRTAVLAGGETTVTLKNQKSKIKNQKLGKPFDAAQGKGGRNMEAVLGALTQLKVKNSKLKTDIIVMSFASDGRDNTEAAGAIGDFLTLKTAEKLGINPRDFLKQNKSFDFFDKTGDLIYANQDCFNVADLMLVLNLPKE